MWTAAVFSRKVLLQLRIRTSRGPPSYQTIFAVKSHVRCANCRVAHIKSNRNRLVTADAAGTMRYFCLRLMFEINVCVHLPSSLDEYLQYFFHTEKYKHANNRATANIKARIPATTQIHHKPGEAVDKNRYGVSVIK